MFDNYYHMKNKNRLCFFTCNHLIRPICHTLSHIFYNRYHIILWIDMTFKYYIIKFKHTISLLRC